MRDKIFVKVHTMFDRTGFMMPQDIIWDDGRTFRIDQVTDFRPATLYGHPRGDCYTVIINGERRLLFFERGDPRFPTCFGRWLVEGAENAG